MELTREYVQEFTKHKQIEEINQVLLELAGGNYHHIAPITDDFDEIDAIASGVNMLSEELRDTVISRNYLDSVIRSVVDMLFIFDERFIIQQITPKACEILKKPEENFIGQPINILFDGRKKFFLQRLKEDLKGEGKLQNVESSFKVKKGKLPVTLSFFALKNNRNITTGYLMVAEDVKDRLLTAKTLEQRNEELKTLIYRTSHDLKGPLSSMLGLFHVLEREEQNLPTLRHYLSLIKGSAEKLNKTLLGLLDIGMGNQPNILLSPFNVNNIIREVVSSLQTYPGREELEITIYADKQLVIKSNEKLFRSILQNLIENSIKYRKINQAGQGKVFITALFQKGGLTLGVRDNGQGMDKNVLKNAFEMFYRGNEGSTGSGLGLFIVKSYVEKLGGEIKIKSKISEGTEVKISLPSITSGIE